MRNTLRQFVRDLLKQLNGSSWFLEQRLYPQSTLQCAARGSVSPQMVFSRILGCIVAKRRSVWGLATWHRQKTTRI